MKRDYRVLKNGLLPVKLAREYCEGAAIIVDTDKNKELAVRPDLTDLYVRAMATMWWAHRNAVARKSAKRTRAKKTVSRARSGSEGGRDG